MKGVIAGAIQSLADTINTAFQDSKNQHAPKTAQPLHQSWGEATSSATLAPRDWQLQVNLGRRHKFPENIATTLLRPDMVLTTESTKQMVLLELTVPWEDWIEEANEQAQEG